MTNALIRRLVWKELRELLPVWIAILLLGMALGSVVALNPNVAKLFTPSSLFTAFGCLFALGAGAALFSNDHENSTIGYLASLPIHPRKLAVAKLAVVIIALLAVLTTGAMFWQFFQVDFAHLFPGKEQANLFGGSMQDGDYLNKVGLNLLVLYFGAPCLLLLMTALSSLVLRNSIVAVVVGAGSLMGFYALVYGTFDLGQELLTSYSLLIHVSGAIILLGVFSIASSNWLTPTRYEHKVRWNRWGSIVERWMPNARNKTAFRRLIWQSAKQAFHWKRLLVLPLLLVFLFIALMFSFGMLRVHYFFNQSEIFLLTCLVASLIISSTIFWDDQRNNSIAFLQNRGVSGLSYWIARIIPWFVLITILGVLYMLFSNWALRTFVNASVYRDWQLHRFQSYVYLGNLNPVDGWNRGTFATISLYWLALAIGQAAALLVRTRISALLLAVFVGIPILLIAMLFNWWSISPFFFCIPMFLAICIGSCCLASNWLVAKDSSLQKAALVLIVAGIGAGLCYGIAEYRRTEIPISLSAIPEWSVEERKTIDSDVWFSSRKRFLEGLRLAAQKYSPVSVEDLDNSEDRANAVSAGREALDEMSKAIRSLPSPEPVLLLTQEYSPASSQEWERETRIWFQLAQLGALHEALDKHDLKSALEYHWVAWSAENLLPNTSRFLAICESFIAWSELPEQTPELIRQAIVPMAKVELLDFTNLYAYRFNQLNQHLANGTQPIINGADPYRNNVFDNYFGIVASFQSENERSLRLAMRLLGVYYQDKNLGYVWSGKTNGSRQTVNSGRYNTLPYSPQDWQEGIFNIENSQTASWLYNVQQDHQVLFRREILRRYLLVRLALTAWRLEHGQYPDRLEQLHVYFPNEFLPLDLTTGRHFSYFPNGLDAEINLDGDDENGTRIPANTPVLFPFPHPDDEPWQKVSGVRVEGTSLVKYEEYQVGGDFSQSNFFLTRDFNALGQQLKPGEK